MHFRPVARTGRPNTDVTLDANLYGVDFGDGVWGQKDRTVSFDVGAQHVSVADAATHTLTVYDGDQLVQTYPMSAGSSKNPTRNGAARRHRVLPQRSRWTPARSAWPSTPRAATAPTSSTPSASPTTASSCTPHPWSVGQQGSSNVSHGCINLSTDRAAWFFDFAQPGDVVEVKNSIGPTLSAADGDIYDWAIPWDQWQAGSALK